MKGTNIWSAYVLGKQLYNKVIRVGRDLDRFGQIRIIQGISCWNGTNELALTAKDMQVKFGLKMVLECCDREFLGTTLIFQKNNISWPQQPPAEKLLNFNMIFHDSIKRKSFSKHQNKVEFKNLGDSEVFSSDFPGPTTSVASLTSSTSATSLASTASKAPFHQKTFWSWW